MTSKISTFFFISDRFNGTYLQGGVPRKGKEVFQKGKEWSHKGKEGFQTEWF